MHTIHRADERGETKQDWLHGWYSFSFANYWNPYREGFGALRVLNDDIIAPQTGFGFHPHNNMEIITIPLAGTLTHKDNTGAEGHISAGDVQVMSAGTGIVHSEMNNDPTTPVESLQIWIEPHTRNVTPRYAQKHFDLVANQLTQVVGDTPSDDALWIHQHARISIGHYEEDTLVHYVSREGNGVFVFIIEGTVEYAGEVVERRDSLEIADENDMQMKVKKGTHIVVLEVPM